MDANTVTLGIDGEEIWLSDFEKSIEHLAGLLSALEREVVGGSKVQWIIDDLRIGSAVATVIGMAQDAHAVERIVSAYNVVGGALARGEQIPYSAPVRKHAEAIAAILDGRITAIRFSTHLGDATIVSASSQDHVGIQWSLGEVEGTVETLSCRGRLRFTLYDALFDRAIRCYIDRERENLIRDVWGRRVIVTGRIGRDPRYGYPSQISDITHIEVLETPKPGAYKAARGALGGVFSDEPPEDVIRRIRDAWPN